MPTKFPVDSLAYSQRHQMFVRVLAWKRGKATVTRFLRPDGIPLSGEVKEGDLWTYEEYRDWARKQPGYTEPELPPTDDLAALLRHVEELAKRLTSQEGRE